MGSKGHLSGLKLPGNNLYPLKFVTKLYQLACQEASAMGIDVQLHTQTPVKSVQKTSQGSWIAQTGRGDIIARSVVHATNAYASHLIPSLLKTDRPVVPCRAQVMAIRPKDGNKFWTTGFCKEFSYCLLTGSELNHISHQLTMKASSTSSKGQTPMLREPRLSPTLFWVEAEVWHPLLTS